MKKLTSGKVYVGTSVNNPINMVGVETVIFDGPHPAGNVGVQIQHIAPVNKGEVVWTLSAFDVLLIGRFLIPEKRFFRMIAVTGSEIVKPMYIVLF